MQLTIHDNQMVKVAYLNNEISDMPHFYNDNWHRYLAEGAATFDFSVNKFKNGTLQDYCQFLNDQAYISFTYEGEDFLFSVLTSEETDDVITLNCATLNLELRNEQANPLVNSSSHNIKWYFDTMGLISYSQISLGINEVSNATRTINYDGQETKLARLLSVIGNFDAEFEFVTELNDDGTLKGIVLNLYKANDGVSTQGVGTWRNDVTLYFGKNISEVRRTIDRTQVFNATTVKGADGLSWKNSEWSVKNEDGKEEFYKRKGSETAYAPLSAELYPSQIQSTTRDVFIRKDFETEYKSANEMWGYALSQFKKYAYALVTYEVSAKSKLVSQAVGGGQSLSIGDTVRIQDKNFNARTGGLILQARVSELEISFSNPSNNKFTFSNYVELESGISDDLEARLAQLIKDSTPYRPDITSTNGTQFKNGIGTTTLGAHIYFGSDTTETIADSYEWSKDGTVVANVQEITVDASGVADKAVYSFKATIAGKVVASQSVTITNVNDGAKGAQGPQGPQGPQGLKGDPGATGIPGQVGADGKTSYLHIAYATNSTGTAGFDVSNATGKTYIGQYTDFTSADSTDPSKYTWSLIKGDKGDKGDTGNDGVAGKNGVGINSTTVTYAISSSGTVTPTAGWTPQVPTLVKGQYLWTKTVWNYSDGTSESGYTVSYIAKDGNNGNDGIAGKDGVGITATTITYAQSTSGTAAPSSGWTSSVPTVPAGQFLWTKTVWRYSDSTSETGYSVAMMGPKGDKGDQGAQGIQGLQGPTGTQGVAGPKGADGKTQYTHIAYANSADGTANFSTSDSNRTYIGMYVDFNINDSTTPGNYSWTLVKGADGTQGTPGKAGADGKTPYFHTAWSYSADGTDRFTTVYPNLNLLQGTNAQAPINSNWKDIGGAQISLATDEKAFISSLTPSSSAQVGLWQEGVSANIGATYTISAFVKNMSSYAFQDFRLTLVTRGNSTNVYPKSFTIPNDNQYHYISFSYQVTATDVKSIGAQFYVNNAPSNVQTLFRTQQPKLELGSTATPHMPSSTEVTTADWLKYIGQYTDFTQADSTNPSAYTWSLIRGNDGKDGVNGKDGVGIKTTVITYAISSSGTVAPTTGWNSQVPTLVNGQYLWTKTDWTYTDNSSKTGYSVTYISKDGNNGNDGIAGKDGVGIKTTTITYAGSTSGTTAPTSGWTSTVPTVAAGSYLWTKTVWSYTDNTSETGYSVAKMGNNGAAGPQGPQGPTGPAGSNGTPGTNAINIDLSNKSYNFLANLEVSDSGSVMQAVAGSTTTTFTALQGTAAINITALTCTTTLPIGMTVSIGTLNALSVVVTISVDDTMVTPNGILNFSITAGGVTTTKSFSYSLAINDLTVINLASINSNLGNVKNIYSHYNGSDGGTYSGTIEINDENIKITATNDNDSNEVSKTQMNGENGIWHSTKLQKTNSPGVYVLSNWSLTGATLSFESQQSDLTYPNGYSYASYGIDVHARNIVGDSISQTNDIPWTNLTLASGFSIGSGGKARYRVENGVLYLHFRKIVCPAMTGNQPNTICYVPANGRASDGYDSFGVMSATNSTRIQYNDSDDGKVAIVPASNTNAGQGFNGILICPMD